MNTEQFQKFLSERKETLFEEAERLIKDERKDEGAFYKAKANIYDVFSAVARTAEKKAEGNREGFIDFFVKSAENIPAQWKKSLEMAREHGDDRKAVIEEFKLEAVKDIMDEFKRVFGGIGE